MGTMSLGGEAEQVITNAGKDTKMATYDAGTDDVSAVDDVADFREKIMTGLEEFYEKLDDPSV